MSRRLLDHLPEIEARWRRSPHRLIALEFDGTLAPLADDPAQVHLSEPSRRLLESLSARTECALAILSGRERGDLQTRIGVPGLIYVGNHGLEISGPGLCFVEPSAAGCGEALRGLAADLAARLQPFTGAFVEEKGLTLSVHYRRAREANHEELRRVVHATLASKDHPFQLSSGDKVYEIRPRVDWKKTAVVGWIKEQLARPDSLVLYVSHDAADEESFEALAGDITVKVGGPAETAAHYHVDGPDEVASLLRWLAETTR